MGMSPRTLKLFLIFLLPLASGCRTQKQPQRVEPSLPPVAVSSEKLELREVPQSEEFAGTLNSVRRATLSTKISGWITFLEVQEGDRVRRGETLIKIDATDLKAQSAQARAGYNAALSQINQAQASVATARSGLQQARSGLELARAQLPEAEAQLALARLEFDRMKSLYQQGAVPQRDFDNAKTNLDVTAARVSQLEAGVKQAQAAVDRSVSAVTEAEAAVTTGRALAAAAASGIEVTESPIRYTFVTSPIDGFVVEKMAEVGEMANPGVPLLAIEDTSTLWLELPIPEGKVGLFTYGQAVPIGIDALNAIADGRVLHIIPSGDPKTHSFTIRVEIKNPQHRLLPGMYGRVVIPTGARKVLSVEADSVVRRGELEGVFVVGPEGKAEYHLVKLGAEVDGRLEVLSGLEPGQEVLLNPPSGLEQGVPVEEQDG